MSTPGPGASPMAVMSGGSPDYLIDIVADGLIRLLGRPSVRLEYNCLTPPDTKRANLLQGFAAEEAFPIEEAAALVVSTRTDIGRARDWAGRTGRPVAVVDGEDDTVIRGDFLALASRYFKREVEPGSPANPKVSPLPMGAIPTDAPRGERTRPVAFVAGYTHPVRAEIWDELARRGLTQEPASFSNHDYNGVLSSSLLGIAAKGVGWDTYRYWETPYFGCCLLAQRPGIVIPDNFRDGEEAFFFDTAGELGTLVETLLSDRPRAERVAQAGEAAVKARHLSSHRARSVLESVL